MTRIVAHTIQIPLGFEFRRQSCTWAVGDAEIVGWPTVRDEDDRELQVHGSRVRVRVSTAHGPVMGDMEANIHEIFEALGATVPYPDAVNSDEMESICAGYTIPVLAMTRKSTKTHVADPWLMRSEFLGLSPEPDAFKDFLSQWGMWDSESILRLETMESEQRDLRDALALAGGDAKLWFRHFGSFPYPHDRAFEYPFFWLKAKECEVAIRMTITMDLLRGIRFGTCARPDCGTPYPIQSEHKRAYCSQYCAHIESVRRQRRDARNKPQKAVKGTKRSIEPQKGR